MVAASFFVPFYRAAEAVGFLSFPLTGHEQDVTIWLQKQPVSTAPVGGGKEFVVMTRVKRLLRASMLLAGLMLLCVGTASAASVGVGTVNVSGLRLREEPSTQSAILNTAYFGDHVVVLEEVEDGWYKVDYKSVVGYMYGKYLDVEATADMDLGYGVVKVSSSLNVRVGPGTKYDKVGFLYSDTVVSITGVENGWYRIAYRDIEGYVSSNYVSLCKGEQGGRGDDEVVKPASSKAEEVIAYAKTFLGTPYVYGGNGPKSFDCSGFTKYVYNHFGYSINRTASTQLQNGRAVEKSELQMGDLVFFRNDGDSHAASHVGIYIGHGQFIHASSDTRTVTIGELNKGNNLRKYVGARRIL